MKDYRQPMENGSIIYSNNIHIRITELLGRGGNAMVYKAEYDDSLVKDGVHICVLKELCPYHSGGGVFRGADGFIHCDKNSEEFFERHKKSFLHGAKVHLNILRNSPDSIGANINSFEQNNTVYSLLGLNSVSTLRRKQKELGSLSEIMDVIVKLVKAVRVFHENNILHLDISPDNIIISQSNGEERVLLIDFNSCGGEEGEYISVNPLYSAPELKIGRTGEITEAADIFSICAVLVYLISGEDFLYAPTKLSSIAKEKLLEGVPHSAVSCLLGMLSKGLRSNPRLRFKSAEEMLETCLELQRRIDNIGITHASLWEMSRRMCGDWNKELLENSILCRERLIPSAELFKIGNTVITGEGGIGKTSLYRSLWRRHTRVYNPSRPIYFFVPLYQYDGQADFIKRYIVSKARFGNGISTVSDAVRKLTELMNNSEPVMYIMLDGFNEISSGRGNIVREIYEIGKMPGVRVSVSARTDTLTEYLKGFEKASLTPLDRENIRVYLNDRSIAYPEDEDLLRLLTNPLMLTLFVKTEEVFQKSGDVRFPRATREEIMNGYMESVVEAYKQAAPEDLKGQLRLSYVVDFLLPALCARAGNGKALDFKAVREVCAKDLRRLKSRAFSREFHGYSGRAEDILGGAKNADEWMNRAFNEILIRDTALMTKEQESYYPLHMNFAEHLTKKHRQNMKRYKKAVLGVRIPLAAAAMIVCLCMTGVAYYYLPRTHPIGKREQKNNYEIMTAAAHSLANVTQMTMSEENLIGQIKEAEDEERTKALEYASKRLDAIGEAIVEVENLSEKAYRGLDVERIEKILDMSEKHRVFQKDMFERLEYALSDESVYTESDIEKELVYYEEYLKNYERLMGYEMNMVTRSISGRGGDVIKEAMRGSGDIVLNFNEAMGIKTKDLENSIKSLELNLKSLEAELGLIQGGE